MGPKEVLPFWVKVDLRVMAMKVYSRLPRAAELNPHHQIQFSVIPLIFLGSNPLQKIQLAYAKIFTFYIATKKERRELKEIDQVKEKENSKKREEKRKKKKHSKKTEKTQ